MIGQIGALLAAAIVVPGIVNRTKAWWGGRRGAPILQLAWDLRRLARKTAVYSAVTTPFFRVAPWVVLACALAAAAVVPTLGVRAAFAFPGDLVWLAYVTGLGRAARLIAALDTGSPFEGMGASRGAWLAVLGEPALFLTLGAGVLIAGEPTVSAAVGFAVTTPARALVWAAMFAALVVIVQVESSRLPVDDPTTHLELTMIHEVTILDHSGPDLAALQLAAAIELTAGLSLLAGLLVPHALPAPAVTALTLVLLAALAVALGTVESLVSRLRMDALPAYVLTGMTAAATALVATLWVRG